MKTKSITLETSRTAKLDSTPEEIKNEVPNVISYKKIKLRSDMAFHKKMIAITLASIVALAAFLLYYQYN